MMLAKRATETVTADQAIFTSIRSPMGEGYRIVAACKGITADEKREILQYAPSHGSLCDPSPDAKALAFFPLSTGRRCLFLTRAAGLEHTGRGGYRVFTHMLVLEPAGMRAFGWNAFALAAAVPEYSDEQVQRPPSNLTPLEIETRTTVGRFDDHRQPRGDEIGKIQHIVSEILSERGMMVAGVEDANMLASCVVGALPMFARQRLSFCHGLKFSPARKFALLITDASPTELKKVERDSAATVHRWKDLRAADDSPYRAWLQFIADRWNRCREGQLREITAGLIGECEPAFLERIANLTLDLEKAPQADRATLRELERAHMNETAAIDVHRHLLDTFKRAIENRRYELDQAEPVKEEIPENPLPQTP